MEYLKLTRTFTALLLLLTTGFINLQAQQGQVHYRHGAGDLATIAEDFGRVFKVQLAYANEELAAVKVPAATYEAGNVGELLNKVLAPGGFNATVAGSNYVIKKTNAPQKLPTIVVKGTVQEGTSPVPGASVIIKQPGQKNVIAIADENGKFSKTVSAVDGSIEITA